MVTLHSQVAYLASTLFLDSSSDLVILAVNTIQRDLKSDNFMVGKYTVLAGWISAAVHTDHVTQPH